MFVQESEVALRNRAVESCPGLTAAVILFTCTILVITRLSSSIASTSERATFVLHELECKSCRCMQAL